MQHKMQHGLKAAFNGHSSVVIPCPVTFLSAVHMHKAVVLDNPGYA